MRVCLKLSVHGCECTSLHARMHKCVSTSMHARVRLHDSGLQGCVHECGCNLKISSERSAEWSVIFHIDALFPLCNLST